MLKESYESSSDDEKSSESLMSESESEEEEAELDGGTTTSKKAPSTASGKVGVRSGSPYLAKPSFPPVLTHPLLVLG